MLCTAPSAAVMEVLGPDFDCDEPDIRMGLQVEAVDGGQGKGSANDQSVSSKLASLTHTMKGLWNEVTSNIMSLASAHTQQLPRKALRETHPRMPWHDLHAGISGPAARDVANHFIQVINTQ